MKSEGGPVVVPNERDYVAAKDAEVGRKMIEGGKLRKLKEGEGR